MKNATMIATFAGLPSLMAGVKEFFPSKLILIVGKSEGEENEFIENASMLKKTVGSIVSIDLMEIDDAKDAYQVAKKALELIGKERKKGKEVILNVCENSKTQPIGLLLAAYASGEKVKKILYTTASRNNIVHIPKVGINLSGPKKTLLQAIAKNPDKNISQISRKIHKTRAIIYRHLAELEEMGLVDENYEITEAGVLVLE